MTPPRLASPARRPFTHIHPLRANQSTCSRHNRVENDLSKRCRNDVDVGKMRGKMSITAPQLCRNRCKSGAEIAISATTLRYLFSLGTLAGTARPNLTYPLCRQNRTREKPKKITVLYHVLPPPAHSQTSKTIRAISPQLPHYQCFAPNQSCRLP